MPIDSPRDHSPDIIAEKTRFWRANLIVTLGLLLVWFTAGPLLSILLVKQLNQFHLGGFPLGFWFAQQGSIICFILVILVYPIVMGVLERGHRRRMQSLSQNQQNQSLNGGTR